MRLKRRMQLSTSQASLQLLPPVIEDLLCRRIESQRGESTFVQMSAKGLWIELIQSLHDLSGLPLCFAIGNPIDVLPPSRDVRPDHQLKALNQPIIARSSAQGTLLVLHQGPWLNPS